MLANDKNLEKFRQWLLSRGRVEGTADLYVHNVRSCHEDKKGVTHRLISGDLAPLSARTNKAALRSWALFTGNSDLVAQLADLRLPPARRVSSKDPLAFADWQRLVAHLMDRKNTGRELVAMRQVVLIMAIRGLRVGDVLRLKRTEVVRALSTGKLAYEGKGRKRLEVAAAPVRDQLQALSDIPNWERVRDLVCKSESPRAARDKVRKASQRYAKEVGIKEMNPHRYRHTFATNYLAALAGDPNAIVKLQKYMGWESMATAARYVEAVSQDQLDEVGASVVSALLARPKR